jgi:16S rRNA processing protein RimM
MININDLLPVGTIARTHGIQGKLILRLEETEANDIPEKEWVFVKIDGLPVPFFISEVNDINDNKVIIAFETVKTESDARKLAGCRIYVNKKSLSERTKKLHERKSIIGYTVHDKKIGIIGTVVEIIDISENPVVRVIGNKELMVPYNKDFILKISHKDKLLQVMLPEGLLEI